MEIVERNFRTRYGEIDIIARDDDCLVFVEVKYRKNTRFGSALEAVDRRKQAQIRRIAAQYISSGGYTGSHRISHMRFDCIGITGSETVHIKNAF